MADEKQVQEADAAITQAVSAFVSEFESMWGRWKNVAPAYVIESALLELCMELSVLAPEIKSVAEPATLRLLAPPTPCPSVTVGWSRSVEKAHLRNPGVRGPPGGSFPKSRRS
jgi:hypothetical protein